LSEQFSLFAKNVLFVQTLASKYNISIDRVEKKYQIMDEDKTLQTKDFHSYVAIERVILNILKDKEYLILPPNGK